MCEFCEVYESWTGAVQCDAAEALERYLLGAVDSALARGGDVVGALERAFDEWCACEWKRAIATLALVPVEGSRGRSLDELFHDVYVAPLDGGDTWRVAWRETVEALTRGGAQLVKTV